MATRHLRAPLGQRVEGVVRSSSGGRSFTTAGQVDEPTAGGVRLWSVVVDGAARLGVMSVTMVGGPR